MPDPNDAIRVACCEHGISLAPEADCPIPTAHVRLSELHLLWHQAASSYYNPALFRANLNAAIQASRNVTFALQAEKANVRTVGRERRLPEKLLHRQAERPAGQAKRPHAGMVLVESLAAWATSGAPPR